jgi:carbon-monoxide dehydrogenase small subunit
VILVGKVVKSCLIPAFRLRGCEVITLEGFSRTPEYGDIRKGFKEAKVETCGFCDAGKVLAVEAFFTRNSLPQNSLSRNNPFTRQEILAAFQGIRCRCSEPDSLAEAVLLIADLRRRRLYGRS